VRETNKVFLIGLSSRILIVVVMVICSFLFATTAFSYVSVDPAKTFPFVGMFERWDSVHYLDIAANGYPMGLIHDDTSASSIPVQWAWFPLYPATMRAVSVVFSPFLGVTKSLMFAGFLVSNIAFFVGVYFFYKLTGKLFGPRVALVAAAFYSFFVGALFYSTLYSEALFMALALGSFFFLEDDRLHLAVFLGFLASFTRSDGFLVFIPFAVYGLQRFRADRWGSGRLFLSSFVVASPWLIWNVVGYFVSGGVFPVSVVSHNLNWGVPVLLYQQFRLFLLVIPPLQTFLTVVGLVLAVLPVGYFVVRVNRIWSFESASLKYWAFYGAMLVVILAETYIYSALRYAVTLLPVYWVLGKVYVKNRVVGVVFLGLSVVMLVLAAYLWETNGPFFA